jgi:hypothetical protein
MLPEMQSHLLLMQSKFAAGTFFELVQSSLLEQLLFRATGSVDRKKDIILHENCTLTTIHQLALHFVSMVFINTLPTFVIKGLEGKSHLHATTHHTVSRRHGFWPVAHHIYTPIHPYTLPRLGKKCR